MLKRTNCLRFLHNLRNKDKRIDRLELRKIECIECFKNLHVGVQRLTFNAIKQSFYIINGGKSDKEIIYKLYNALSRKTHHSDHFMSQLSKAKVIPQQPFIIIAID